MKKCYIAGKIGDLPVSEFTNNFTAAKKEVEALGMIPVSPVDLPHNHGGTWSEYMREDLIEMLKCDYVYALRNWDSSRGATVEVETALKIKMNIIHQKQLPAHPERTL